MRRGSTEQQDKPKVRFIWELGNTPASTKSPRHPGVDFWAVSRWKGASLRRALWVLALAALALPARAEERYSVKDKGGFGSTGRVVELASRYGWDSYELNFDFGVDLAAHGLEKGSKLRLRIIRRDGSDWQYTCKAGPGGMTGNVNNLYGKGTTVLAECPISPRKFAKALGLDEDLVGEPTLVFQVTINDGKAVPGVQKGIYFVETRDISAGELAPYASPQRDPSNLGVLFSSAMAPYMLHPEFARVPRYLP